MPRYPNFEPKGVIPACILPFHEDLSIDEASYRGHLRHTAAISGVSAITVNAHATEVASCSFEEQRRILDLTMDAIGDRVPVVNGVYADGSVRGRAACAHGARRRGLGPAGFPAQPVRSWANTRYGAWHISKRLPTQRDLPLIAFQYPLAGGQGYPMDTLLRLVERRAERARDQGLVQRGAAA